MGKDWDRGIPGEAFWREALRVAKPGAYLLAFGGTRTFHRLACAIEDAGWEIRDTLGWLYGSGFPKSLDVSKAIDKQLGVERVTIGASERQPAGFIRRGRTDEEVFAGVDVQRIPAAVTLPATPEATEWQGFGTALKPAWEPIILARKPVSEGSVARNVLKWGTGGINIDGCRIAGEPWTAHRATGLGDSFFTGYTPEIDKTPNELGRWPANIITDGSEEVVSVIPQSQRFFYCAKASRSEREEGLEELPEQLYARSGGAKGAESRGEDTYKQDSLGLNRITKVRNNHPTVKPISLMRYLCKLITPPNGIVLDMFAGSGSTGKAAVLEGFRFIGIELDASYCEIARHRIQNVRQG